MGHAPFAYWLVGALRPRAIAELGTHFGFSYFVLCEAVKRFGLQASVHALDTWGGDDHAGFYGDDVHDQVAKTTATDYSDVGTMLRCTFDEGLAHIEDGSLDLLHIDGRHGFDDVRHDFESWLPKLSERAVVIMHDVAAHRPGFGVWKYWEQLEEQYADTFKFDHSFGLGIVGVGSKPSSELRSFFAAARADGDAIRDWYARAGGLISSRAEAHAKVRRALDRSNAALDEVRVEASRLEKERDAILGSTSWKISKPVRVVGSRLGRSKKKGNG
jgi:hypothetical protein